MARRAAADLSALGDWVRTLGEQIGVQLGQVIAQSVQRTVEASIDVPALARRLGGGPRGAAVTSVRGSRRAGAPDLCQEPGCGNPVLAKGLCRSHYYRARYRSQKEGTLKPASKRGGGRQAKGNGGRRGRKPKAATEPRPEPVAT